MMSSVVSYGSRAGDGLRNYHNTAACIAAWIRGSENGKNRSSASVFFVGPTIYSYGTHFPIARLLGDGAVFFTIDRYSVTTGGHCSAVSRVLSYRKVFHVAHVVEERHDDNMRSYAARLADALRKSARARVLGEYHERGARALCEEANQYAERFGSNIRLLLPVLDDSSRLFYALSGRFPLKSLRDVTSEHVLKEAA